MDFTNASVITNGNRLSYDLQLSSKDPFEQQLSRTTHRVIGGIFSLFSFGLPSWIYIFDVSCDHKKLNLIQEKKIDIQSQVLNKNSEDFEKAKASLLLQLSVAENIQSYTETAARIKKLAAVGYLLLWTGVPLVVFGSLAQSREFSGIALAYTGVGALLAIPSTTYGLAHSCIQDSSLKRTNQALAADYLRY